MNQSAMQAKLVVLLGPSGAGKSTLVEMLLRDFPTLQLSVSCTTRAPRGQELHGVHYFFCSEAEFQAKIKRGEFLEYAHVFGRTYYGTLRSTVESALAKGKSVLFDIEVQGAAALKRAFVDRCVTIFIHPPSLQILEQRLRDRKTETETAIRERLKTAAHELTRAAEFDYQVTNTSVDLCYNECVEILKGEHVLS